MTSRFETPPMFSDFVIPGCRNLVSDAYDACDSCRTAFGPYLVFNPGPPPSAGLQRTPLDVEPGSPERRDHPEPGGKRIPQSCAGYADDAEPVPLDPVVGNATPAEPSSESTRDAWDTGVLMPPGRRQSGSRTS